MRAILRPLAQRLCDLWSVVDQQRWPSCWILDRSKTCWTISALHASALHRC